MKNLLTITALVLAMLFAISSNAQTVNAVQGKITLTPVKVVIPSTGEMLYLANLASGGYAIFVTKDTSLYDTLVKGKGKDSLIVLEGARFSPLQHYSKKQWKRLSKEVKMFFPAISQEELEKMPMYLIFNYGFEPKKIVAPTSGTTPSQTPTGGGKKKSIEIP